MYRTLLLSLTIFLSGLTLQAGIQLIHNPSASNRVEFAVKSLSDALSSREIQNDIQGIETARDNTGSKIFIFEKNDPNAKTVTLKLGFQFPSGLKKEGFQIQTKGDTCLILGNDGNGLIYGCRELIERMESVSRNKLQAKCLSNFDALSPKNTNQLHLFDLNFPTSFTDAPEMVLRGTAIGIQKPTYLPGRDVYEYPYTPENFPWFYDKEQWIKYLDMLVKNRMNSVYLWNGHPFASLVKLKEYPYAVEVDDATFKKNEEIYDFITREADKRGIFVIQMFYNIILSKPFAEHFGIATQDRNRPITPLASDYTRKSITAFIEKYPNVGLLVCLGEAMDTYEDDVKWFTQTIIPGVKDGLKSIGRTDEPPLLLRAHDTSAKMVMDAALPLYKNLYTMHKYNGESLTTYQPRGPWAEIHKELSSLGSVHISNVHILANLEPWRYGSPDFIQKTVQAMHDVHGANALHLYPQSSFWDWPNTADKLRNGQRLKQTERDWIWYQAWARYAWNCRRDREKEKKFWDGELEKFYGMNEKEASKVRVAYEETGEIAPKLLRRFGITEGNRQSLLLGMFVSQLINPYKYTIYPGFYESCGPEGEKLIEWSEKEWKHQPHQGELPLDIISQVITHADRAIEAIDQTHAYLNLEEFERLSNDIHCYHEFAYFFKEKVLASKLVLDYQWSKDIKCLDKAVPHLEKSLAYYTRLVELTKDHYLYANSMQTAQRRIPIGGDDGKNKTWEEMLPHYQKELENFRKNIGYLKQKKNGKFENRETIAEIVPASVNLSPDIKTRLLKTGESLYNNRPSVIEAIAPELTNMQNWVLDDNDQKKSGTKVEFSCQTPVYLWVGYFRDNQNKFAKAPTLETDASANNRGQAEPVLINAMRIKGMPLINIHSYEFAAGHHELMLPKGMCTVFGFSQNINPTRDAGFAGTGSDDSADWLFF